jgi:hypothetical protein
VIAGRESAFSDTEIIRMAKEDFIPVSADDWYERRRDDAVGQFFRKVADQGPRKGEGGNTRQGIYCLTADGKLLAYKNAGQNAEVMREVLQVALAAWKKLPEEQRKPGAVTVEDAGKLDARYTRKPPAGTVIVKVYTRILDKDEKGEICKGTCSTLGGDKAARDHLWLTADDIKALVPAEPKIGDKFPLSAAVAERIARFHLLDNTRGEPPMWKKEETRRSDISLTVTEVTPQRVRLRLEGNVLLSTEADAEKAKRGYDVRLLGQVAYDRDKKALDRFDVVALGDHWGEGTYTRNARPGRTPLGVAFELAAKDDASARVPPQAAREIGAYLGTGK